jgi:hypothetical protein
METFPLSFDLSVWRRSPTTKTAMIVQVYEVIGTADHPAAGMFDADEFVRAAAGLYELDLGHQSDGSTSIVIPNISGAFDGEPFAITLWPWTGATSACVSITGNHEGLRDAKAAMLPLIEARDLMLYDPQSQSVYNNRRKYD